MASDGRWAGLEIKIKPEFPSTLSINKPRYKVGEPIMVTPESGYPGAWVGFYEYSNSDPLDTTLMSYYSLSDSTSGEAVDILHDDIVVDKDKVADLPVGKYKVILFTSGYDIDRGENGSLLIRSFDIEHSYNGPEWEWEADHSAAQAIFTAVDNESLVQAVDATVTSEVTTQPTYTKEGVKTYTATVDVNFLTESEGPFVDTYTEAVPVLPPDAAYVEELVSALPAKATLADKEQIEAARAVYEGLSTEEQANVPAATLAKLEMAEAWLEVAEAQAAADAAAAQAAADQAEADAAAQAAAEAAAAATAAQEKADADQAKADAAAQAAAEAAATAAAAQEKADADQTKADAAAQAAAEAAAAATAAQEKADADQAKADAAATAAAEAQAKADADTAAAAQAVADAEKAVADAEKAAADAQAAQKDAEDRATAAEEKAAAAEGSQAEIDALKIKVETLETKALKVKSLKVTPKKTKKAIVKYASLGEGFKYQVKISTKKSSGFKTKATTAKTKVTVKGLKKGKTYYFKVRGFKTIDGKKVYTGYSKTIKIKAK